MVLMGPLMRRLAKNAAAAPRTAEIPAAIETAARRAVGLYVTQMCRLKPLATAMSEDIHASIPTLTAILLNKRIATVEPLTST